MSDAPPRFAPDVLGGAGRHDDRKRGPPRLPHTLTTADRPATGAFGTDRSTDEPVAGQNEPAQSPAEVVTHRRHGRYLGKAENILWRTCEQIGEDRLLAVAAGVVF
jgi:hypothetical protein